MRNIMIDGLNEKIFFLMFNFKSFIHFNFYKIVPTWVPVVFYIY